MELAQTMQKKGGLTLGGHHPYTLQSATGAITGRPAHSNSKRLAQICPFLTSTTAQPREPLFHTHTHTHTLIFLGPPVSPTSLNEFSLASLCHKRARVLPSFAAGKLWR